MIFLLSVDFNQRTVMYRNAVLYVKARLIAIRVCGSPKDWKHDCEINPDPNDRNREVIRMILDRHPEFGRKLSSIPPEGR